MADEVRRKPILAILAFHAALLLAVLSAFLSTATIVPEAEKSGLLQACALAAASIGLVCFSWSRMPRGVRVLGAAVLGLAALGGLYSASRLLA